MESPFALDGQDDLRMDLELAEAMGQSTLVGDEEMLPAGKVYMDIGGEGLDSLPAELTQVPLVTGMPPVAVYELYERNCEEGYAIRLWECSIGLAEFIASSLFEQPAALEGQRVIELGAGVGLPALAVLAASPKSVVTATDVSPKGLRLIRAAASEMSLDLHAAELFDLCDAAAPLPPCELLLACEVLYTVELAVGLARRCIEALRAGAHVLVGCSGRPARQRFLDVLAAEGLVGAQFEQPIRGEDGRLRFASSFVEWLGESGEALQSGGHLRRPEERLRLVHIQDDARLFGIGGTPQMV